jgi:hypothetical protein
MAAPIGTPGAVADVGDRIKTHVRISRRHHAGRRSAGRRWCCGLRRSVPGDLERPVHNG